MAEINPNLLLQIRPQADVGRTFGSILTNVANFDRIRENREQAPLRNQLLQQQVDSGQLRNQQQVGINREQANQALTQFAARIKPMLDAGDTEGVRQLVQQQKAGPLGGAADSFLNILDTNPALAKQRVDQVVELGRQSGQFGGARTADTRNFENLTSGLSEEEKDRAKRIKLGLEPRAVTSASKVVDVGGVPHVFEPNQNKFIPVTVKGDEVTVKDIGQSKAQIAEATEKGKGRGVRITKTIDKGFDAIGKIDTNIRNIDRAINALDKGANTGAVQRFLPSVTAATKELEQVRNELALDVIGSVTFGALSQGELDLAQETALPTGLDEPELKEFLMRKKEAQEKLRNYYRQQIAFLDGGGTVAEFLESQQPKQADFSGFKIISVE